MDWKDSKLATRISSESKINNLDQIFKDASALYVPATWPGWVDHSMNHIMRVLEKLDSLIPNDVLKKIEEDEAFILIAGTILHDIGMTCTQKDTNSLEAMNAIRLTHGQRGVEIINKHFKAFIPHDLLAPICEVVKNHHGKFAPMNNRQHGYLRADALWVRLADELDFGPERAPCWLLDYIRPEEGQLKYWLEHNKLESPIIDLKLFRIQVQGTVEEGFIRKLRAEFEAPERQELQQKFLSRGNTYNQFPDFVIWDTTSKIEKTGEDNSREGKGGRLIQLDEEHYFLGAKYLYNMAQYKTAKKIFEEYLHRFALTWQDKPAANYFYHYLKTLHALGEHKNAIQIFNKMSNLKDFEVGVRADINIASGMGYWKLGRYREAIDYLNEAVSCYESNTAIGNDRNLYKADANTIRSVIYLEEVRTGTNIDYGLTQCINLIKEAEQLFHKYEKGCNKKIETHYMGRYWGAKAFINLYMIDNEEGDPEELLAVAKTFSKKAYGGDNKVNRNTAGIMCGKYCSAAIHYFAYAKGLDSINRLANLEIAANAIKDVRQIYDESYGYTATIYRLWPKIHRLFTQILSSEHMPESLKYELEKLGRINADVDNTIEIFTPLN